MKLRHIIATASFLSVSMAASAQTIVGNDRDEHGCIGSAGYTYSALKKECIQVFTQEIQLTQVSSNESYTKIGAVVFDSKMKKAEIFIAELNKSTLILNRKGKTDAWKGGEYELTRSANAYSLKKNGTEIYKTK
ncbi:MAG: hypothetical protein ACT6QS_03175 [Flavobacteriales bacterium]